MLTNKDLSHFMLVRGRYKKQVSIVVPVFLGAIDEVIDSFQDLAWVIDKLFPKWNKRMLCLGSSFIDQNISSYKFSLESLFKLIHEVFYEIRKQKRWKLAEIDVEDIYLKVEFF